MSRKNTIRLARTVAAALAPPSQKMMTGGPGDLHRAAAEAGEQADADGDRQASAGRDSASPTSARRAGRSTSAAMNQRSTVGSTTTSAMVPNGIAIAAAIVIGRTSRQVQRGKACTANGAPTVESISSSVGAAMRGS